MPPARAPSSLATGPPRLQPVCIHRRRDHLGIAGQRLRGAVPRHDRAEQAGVGAPVGRCRRDGPYADRHNGLRGCCRGHPAAARRPA
eukprot:scaffold13676_cov138-Isochrysis_galbana.AAC.1